MTICPRCGRGESIIRKQNSDFNAGIVLGKSEAKEKFLELIDKINWDDEHKCKIFGENTMNKLKSGVQKI